MLADETRYRIRKLLEADPHASQRRIAGDASLAHRDLGWAPSKRFEEMVAEIVESDLRALQNGRR